MIWQKSGLVSSCLAIQSYTIDHKKILTCASMSHTCLKCAVFKSKHMTFVQIPIPTLDNSRKSSTSCMTNWQHQQLSLLFVHLEAFDSLPVCLRAKFSSQSHSFILFFHSQWLLILVTPPSTTVEENYSRREEQIIQPWITNDYCKFPGIKHTMPHTRLLKQALSILRQWLLLNGILIKTYIFIDHDKCCHFLLN